MKEVIEDGIGIYRMMIDGREVGRVAYIAHEDAIYNNVTNQWAGGSLDDAREWAERTLNDKF